MKSNKRMRLSLQQSMPLSLKFKFMQLMQKTYHRCEIIRICINSFICQPVIQERSYQQQRYSLGWSCVPQQIERSQRIPPLKIMYILHSNNKPMSLKKCSNQKQLTTRFIGTAPKIKSILELLPLINMPIGSIWEAKEPVNQLLSSSD